MDDGQIGRRRGPFNEAMSPVETNQAEARGTLECPLPVGIRQGVS